MVYFYFSETLFDDLSYIHIYTICHIYVYKHTHNVWEPYTVLGIELGSVTIKINTYLVPPLWLFTFCFSSFCRKDPFLIFYIIFISKHYFLSSGYSFLIIKNSILILFLAYNISLSCLKMLMIILLDILLALDVSPLVFLFLSFWHIEINIW